MADAKKPNILVIMSDQHGAWATGAYGHPFVQTPNLDALARRGVVFESAYCNSPICGPSRASFLTGRYVPDIEAWDNGKPLPSDIPTWAHYLSIQGYQTVLAGKQHFIGPDQQHGFEVRLGGEVHGKRIMPEHWDPFNPPFDTSKWLVSGEGRHRFHDYDEEMAERAGKFLGGEGRDYNRPFALCVSFITPHFPLIVEKEYLDMYWPHHGDLPEIPRGYVERMHPEWRHLREHYSVHHATEEMTRKGRAAYYGLVTFMDRQVGKVLRALEAAGLSEDTVVIYTADHGEHLGDHELWWKSSFFEASARIPLIVSWPGQVPEGERRREIVSLVDVVATILDIAGFTEGEEIAGRSLLPLLTRTNAFWDNVAICDYTAPTSKPRRMIRRERYKLNLFHDHPPELYDLDRDPGEWFDLAGQPEYAQVIANLSAEARRNWDPEEIWARIQVSRRRRRLILRAERTYLGPLPLPSQPQVKGN